MAKAAVIETSPSRAVFSADLFSPEPQPAARAMIRMASPQAMDSRTPVRASFPAVSMACVLYDNRARTVNTAGPSLSSGGIVSTAAEPSVTDKMRHLEGDFNRKLDHPGIPSVLIPGRLVNELFSPGFFDRVDVNFPVVHDVPELDLRLLRMAVEDVRADEPQASVLLERLSRLGVHLQDLSLSIGDSYRNREFLDPGRMCHRCLRFRKFGK